MSVHNSFVIYWILNHQVLEVMNDTVIHCIMKLAPTAQCSCSREHQQRDKGQNQTFSCHTYGHKAANARKSGVFADSKCCYN